MTDLSGKNIVIVGGTSGIGLATLSKLVQGGAHVYNLARRSVQVSGVTNIELDVTSDFSQIGGLPDMIHGLVYCPGTINLKPFQSIGIDDYRKEMEINLFGAIKVIKACLKGLRAAGASSVVLFSTVAVSQGMAYHAGIASAKGAVEGLAKTLAAEYSKANIRFNVIAPSLTDTPLAAALLNSDDKRKTSDERHPLKRIGKSEDLAAGVTYLLSLESSWMTGQVLHIDGGMSAIKML